MSFVIGPDLIQRYEDNEPFEYCPRCGVPMDYIDCDSCGGEGYFDGERLMEEDPLWYDEDSTENCTDCNGNGGWWHCFNCAVSPWPPARRLGKRRTGGEDKQCDLA